MKRWAARLLGIGDTMRKRLLSQFGPRERDEGIDDFPLAGFSHGREFIKYVESLGDRDLQELNRLLPWKAFVVDSKGRRFGDRAWPGKRETPGEIPDRRIVLLDERYTLRDKHVLEVGCFEGIHTVALCMFAQQVTAVDSRIENVVKTIVRSAFFGFNPTTFKCDVEDEAQSARLPMVDLVHHVGVLYHLKDPAGHLLQLGRMVRKAVMIDSHFALPEEATHRYLVEGREVPYKRYGEGGRTDVLSGMYEHAKWLTLDGIVGFLSAAGLPHVEIVEQRAERNGPRVLLFASK